MTNVIIICSTIVILGLFELIYKLKKSCRHKWIKVDHEYSWNTELLKSGQENNHNYSHRYEILQCEKCGEIKTVKIV